MIINVTYQQTRKIRKNGRIFQCLQHLNTLFWVYCLLSPWAIAQAQTATVSGIRTGDTIILNQARHPLTLRLACITAPAMADVPDGELARRHLQRLLPVGTLVNLEQLTTESFGHRTAIVLKGDSSINLAMVAAGQATINPDGFTPCEESLTHYEAAQSQAQSKQLGLWRRSPQTVNMNGDRGP